MAAGRRNLTAGTGAAQQIQFRVVRFGAGGGGRGGRGGGFGAAADEDEGIDLSKPVMLSAYGDRTKKSGYWQVMAGEAPKPLIWADKAIGGAQKADDADRVVFTEQDYNEFPDYWATNTLFASPRKVTDADPFLSEYAWSAGKVLIDYSNSKGQKLQGTLGCRPATSRASATPCSSSSTRLMSNTHHNFSTPGYSNSPQHLDVREQRLPGVPAGHRVRDRQARARRRWTA